MSKGLAIVLVSGGMDSCVTAAIANIEYRMAFLHVNYGQRTEKRELQAFNEIADYYNIEEAKRFVADIAYLQKIGGSSLTDPDIEIPGLKMAETGIPNTYVPFRNTHLLSIAVSWAEVMAVKYIFIGAVSHDSPCYPDCREEYYDAINKLIEVGTKPGSQIKVMTPIIRMKKGEIVKKGLSLNAPLHLTWSCYKNNDHACGECNSCLLRSEAFQGAGIEDQALTKGRALGTPSFKD